MTSNLPVWTALDSGALPLPSAVPGEAGCVTAIVATAGAVEAGWAGIGAVTLARWWAGEGHRVVLTDTDVLAPTLHEELGLPNHEGLSDVLLWGASVRRVSHPVEDAGFYLMPAGTVVADGTEPFEVSRWAQLCDGFREAGVILVVFTPDASASAGSVLAQASEVVFLAEASEDLGPLADRIGLPVRGVVGRREDEAGQEAPAPTTTETGPAEPADVPPAESGGARPDGPLPGEEVPDTVGAEAEEGTPPQSGDRGAEGLEATEVVETDESAGGGEEPGAAEPMESTDVDAPRVPPLDEVLKAVVARHRRPSRRGPVFLVVLFVVLLGIVAAALLGFLQIPGIPSLFGARAHPDADRGTTVAVSPVASVAADPSDMSTVATHATEMTPVATPAAEVTPIARFDVALAAYRSAETATARAARLRRSLPGTVVSSVPVEVSGTVYYRVLVGVAADSAAAVALSGRIAKATGLSPKSWVVRSTPLAFSFGETADLEAAAGRVHDLVGLDLPAYLLAVDYSDGSVRYRIYVGAFADKVEASHMSARLRELGLDGATLSDRFGRLPE